MKAILLNSGGPDTLASILKLKSIDSELELHSIFIDIGQPNRERASIAAKLIANEYCISHENLLFPGEWTVPDYINPEKRVRTPYLVVLLHILGAVKARQHNVEYIILGIDSNFNRAIQHKFSTLLAEEKRAPYVVIPIYPVLDMTREERLSLIKDNKLSDLTVSCLEEMPCKTCGKCVSRINCGLIPN
jgi:7-cyano-7-deazaguanine synthase in queuosine biosynthesis